MMETPTITAKLRERMGTRYARRERSQGRLPAVIYGHGSKPVHVTIDETEQGLGDLSKIAFSEEEKSCYYVYYHVN